MGTITQVLDNPPDVPNRLAGVDIFNLQAPLWADWQVVFHDQLVIVISQMTTLEASLAAIETAIFLARDNTYTARDAAQAARDLALTYRDAANNAAAAAAASASTAYNSAATDATSVTSNIIGTGVKTFTVQTGKNFSQFKFVIIAKDAANYMIAQIQSYDPATGVLVVNVLAYVGAGTYATWTITLSAPLVKTSVGVVADSAALAAVLVPSNNDTSIVTNYGFYRFDSGFVGAVDGETAIATVDGTAGAWVCESVSPDMLLAILADDFDNIYNRLEAVEGASGAGAQLTGVFQLSAATLGASGQIEYTCSVPSCDIGDTAIATPSYRVILGAQPWMSIRTEIRAKGVVTVILSNQSPSQSVALLGGLWCVRAFKK